MKSFPVIRLPDDRFEGCSVGGCGNRASTETDVRGVWLAGADFVEITAEGSVYLCDLCARDFIAA